MRYRRAWLRVATASLVAGSLFGLTAAAAAEGACTPGKTKKIAFMLKQQTAFRYLNADVPFFKKTAEAAGYEVIVQSAENDAQNTDKFAGDLRATHPHFAYMPHGARQALHNAG